MKVRFEIILKRRMESDLIQIKLFLKFLNLSKIHLIAFGQIINPFLQMLTI